MGPAAAALPSLDELPHRLWTTSGRAALVQALRQLRLPADSGVLVPTYHCPTMVAPIVASGLRPVFYAIDRDGRADLGALEARGLDGARAMLVAHWFGIPRRLDDERAFCDRHRLALLEDCAHAWFGQAGDRPVGAWGDYAIGSATKFWPVPEAGLLASAARPIDAQLVPRGLLEEAKGLADLLEVASRHRRPFGLTLVLRATFGLKRAVRRSSSGAVEVEAVSDRRPAHDPVAEALAACDLQRADRSPLEIASRLVRRLPRHRIVERRRAHWALYAEGLRPSAAGWPLPAFASLSAPAAAPYVFPFRVRDADRVYAELRARGAPVLRWDRRWPGTPRLADDAGDDWSRHVLQFLCHQDLSPEGVLETIAMAHDCLGPASRSSSSKGGPQAAARPRVPEATSSTEPV